MAPKQTARPQAEPPTWHQHWRSPASGLSDASGRAPRSPFGTYGNVRGFARASGATSSDPLAQALERGYRQSWFDERSARGLCEIAEGLGLSSTRLSSEGGIEAEGGEVRVLSHRGKVREIGLFGIDPRLIPRIASEIRQRARARGIRARVYESGSTIDVTPPESDKGRAADAFAAVLGLHPYDLVRIGDRASSGGNDENLVVGRKSYNVGRNPAKDPRARKTAESYARGTTGLLRSWDPSRVPAIATDFDWTLTMGDGVLPGDTARELVRYLNAGTRIAIITGRGLEVRDLVVPVLAGAGVEAYALRNLLFAPFNGALFAPAVEADRRGVGDALR